MPALDDAIRGRLLKAARAAIAGDLFGTHDASGDEGWPVLEPRGVFVTLRKAGKLRGCIGTFVPQGELPETVRRMAVSAAHDPRFVHMPIGAAEMKDLHIDISVLSPLERIEDPLSLVIGRHGIYVCRGHHSGCFLPEVASENGWDAETLLTQCCSQKAGMDPRAWTASDTEISVFTVEKFGDPTPV